MFQRFKSAIDRTIAEEQARQKATDEQRTASPSGSGSGSRPRSASRTNSGKDSPAKRRVKKPQDTNGDNVPNTDPAVFEAAFALDEEEGEAKATAAEGVVDEKGTADEDAPKESFGSEEKSKGSALIEDGAAAEKNGQTKENTVDEDVSAIEPPQTVKLKLKKLEKLEKTYPGVLQPNMTQVYRLSYNLDMCSLLMLPCRAAPLLPYCSWPRYVNRAVREGPTGKYPFNYNQGSSGPGRIPQSAHSERRYGYG